MPEQLFRYRAASIALVALMLGCISFSLARAAESGSEIENIKGRIKKINALATTAAGEKALAGTDFPSSLKFYKVRSFTKIQAILGLSHLSRTSTIYYEAERPLLIIHKDKYYRRNEATLEFDTINFSHVDTTSYYFVNGGSQCEMVSKKGKSSEKTSEELTKRLDLEAKGFLRYIHSNDPIVSIE